MPTYQQFKPCGRRVLVRRNPPVTMTAQGFHIPVMAQVKSRQSKVIAVGEKVSDLKPGHEVLLQQYGGTDIRLAGEEFLLVNEADILAIIPINSKPLT